MALVLADRVLETTSVAGTGDAQLNGAQANYQPFSVIGNGSTTYYTIVDNTNNEWEVGIGTYVLVGNKITRDTVLSSSNGGALVYFGSGDKDIFLDLPSEKVLLSAGDVTGPATSVSGNFALFDGVTGKLLEDAGYNASAFATSAQGALADTAVQPGDLGTAAYLDAGSANGVATLDAGGKVPTSQIPQMGDLNYQGTWNASTNTPTLTSSSGTKGFYYVVSVAGNTNLNGITDWAVGDWAVFNGSVWQKIDNTDLVTSVNGYTGTVVLTYTDVGAQPAGTYVTSVSATSPVTSTGGTTPTIAMPAATTSVSGYLTSTDWNTFNNKSNTTGTVTSVSGTGTVSGISLSGTVTSSGSLTLGGTLDLSSPPVIGGTTPNTITGSTINANTKFVAPDYYAQSILGGNLRTSGGTSLLNWDGGGSGNITVNGGLLANPSNKNVSLAPTGTGTVTINPATAGSFNNMVIGATTPLAITGTTITATTFNGSGSGLTSIPNSALTNSSITINGSAISLGGSVSVGTVTSVTGTAPVVSSGGATPAISMAAANTTTDGYLTSTDWNTFNGKGSGTVTSITAGTGLSGGTITSTGTIALANTAVSAGSYTLASITVDAQGRITSASSGSAGGVTSLAGTANQITASASTGAVTLSTPSTFIAPGSIAATTSVTGTVVSATNGMYINSNTIGTSYSIPSGSNAMSVGPITVSGGVSVTVPSGSNWVVL